MLCHHCGIRQISGPRKLCRPCYLDPATRARHPDLLPTSRKGSATQNVNRLPAPNEPTQAIPGSEAKLQVLEARCAAGVALWHPLDLVEPTYPIGCKARDRLADRVATA